MADVRHRMPIPGWPQESYKIAQGNVNRIEVYLFAQSGDCKAVQSRYPLEKSDWNVTRIGPMDLADLDPGPSWFIAALVCDGDRLDSLIEWAKWRERDDSRRIRFFGRPSLSEESIEGQWIEAGLLFTGVVTFSGFNDFHKEFAVALLEQVLDDFG